MNNDFSLNQGDGAQFGEYTSTTGGKKGGSGSYGEYQTTTKEITMDRDILKETSEGITLGDLQNSLYKEGAFDAKIGSSYDVLQATSAAKGEGAQFGEYQSSKVNATQSVDARASTGDIKTFQADRLNDLGFNLGDFQTTNTKLENTAFDYNAYPLSESIVNTTSALNSDNFTSSTHTNAGFDFGNLQMNQPTMDANLNEILHQSIEPEVDNANIDIGEVTNEQLVDTNINIETTSNLNYKTYQTTDKTTSLKNNDTAEYPSTSPLLDIIPNFDSNEFMAKESNAHTTTNHPLHEVETYDAAELIKNEQNTNKTTKLDNIEFANSSSTYENKQTNEKSYTKTTTSNTQAVDINSYQAFQSGFDTGSTINTTAFTTSGTSFESNDFTTNIPYESTSDFSTTGFPATDLLDTNETKKYDTTAYTTSTDIIGQNKKYDTTHYTTTNNVVDTFQIAKKETRPYIKAAPPLDTTKKQKLDKTAYITANDLVDTTQTHKEGKIHSAYLKIRQCLDLLRKKRIERQIKEACSLVFVNKFL